MTSIDELFKGVGAKRKLDAVQDPNEVYKQSKRSGEPSSRKAAVEEVVDEDNDGSEGPELPPDFEEDAGDDEDGRFFGGGVNRDTAQAIAFLDAVDGDETIKQEKIDASWLRKLALSFEKKLSANATLRAKYPDQPDKFMASEADLDGAIKTLSTLAEHAELYPEFVQLGCVASLTSLLTHENTDIAIDAAEIAAELVDDDVAEIAPAAWTELVAALLDASLVDLLHDNLARLDETTEADRAGVTHILNILAALAARPPGTEALAAHAALLPWLVARACRSDTDARAQNAQSAAEALAILLQASPASRAALVQNGSLDALLQRLAPYRRGDPPHGSDEAEYAENILAALIHGLAAPDGPAAFLELEGIELAVLLLDAPGRATRARAVRLLDHALAHGPPAQRAAAAARCVDAAGLKPLFALLRRARDAPTLEHALAVVAALLRHLPAESPERIRLLAKFVEKKYTALRRVIELRARYARARRGKEGAASGGAAAAAAGGEEGDDDEDDLEALARVYPQRLADQVLAWLVAEDDGAAAEAAARLAEQDEKVADVARGLREQMADLNVEDREADEQEAAPDAEAQRERESEREERERVREMLGALAQCLE